jgi:hypothetical protein
MGHGREYIGTPEAAEIRTIARSLGVALDGVKGSPWIPIGLHQIPRVYNQ